MKPRLIPQPLTQWDYPETWHQYQLDPQILVAGVDEVGRGALFGPVVTAAVAMPIAAIGQLRQLGVRDSKQLSPRQRQALAMQIPPLVSAWHISFADVPTINRINIRQASLLAMHRAVVRLTPTPQHVLIDGQDSLPELHVAQTAVIQGDKHSALIGAASILAKVWRDRRIVQMAKTFPDYELERNKGYGTAAHRQAIQERGVTPLHREKFCLKILNSND